MKHLPVAGKAITLLLTAVLLVACSGNSKKDEEAAAEAARVAAQQAEQQASSAASAAAADQQRLRGGRLACGGDLLMEDHNRRTWDHGGTQSLTRHLLFCRAHPASTGPCRYKPRLPEHLAHVYLYQGRKARMNPGRR